jgi:hypothetical protein
MSQRARSPVLGYNHNLRHGGRVFHVQTEDSGLGYARLYTHLFYEGTILSSKKQEYDPSSPEDVVRSAMQKLHKLMIMELTHAEHDARIAAFFTARGESAALTDPAAVVAAAPTPAAQVRAPSPSPAPVEPSATVQPAPAPVPVPVAPTKMVPKPVVTVQPTAARRPSVVVSNAADGVVVRRNVVINVGAGQPPVNGTIEKPSAPAPWPARARAGGHYAVRDGGYVAGNRARAITTQEAQPQPLASAREIRMPWETPAPTRIAPQPSAAVQVSAEGGAAVVVSTGKIRMPWDVPPAAAPEAFSAELVSDKSLDEVILEYLADDGETDER